MGYNTRFSGVLKFTCEPTTAMLAMLNGLFGQDAREIGGGRESGYIDLELTKDFSGIQWDSGTEKTYYLEKSVNLVIQEMRKAFPVFGLTGTLLAQGEDVEDRWELYIGDDGLAHKRKVAIPGTKVKCPHCHQSFYYEGSPSNG